REGARTAGDPGADDGDVDRAERHRLDRGVRLGQPERSVQGADAMRAYGPKSLPLERRVARQGERSSSRPHVVPASKREGAFDVLVVPGSADEVSASAQA